MNAHRLHSLIAILTLVCFLLVAWSMPADAQKKQKSKTQTKEQTKDTSKDQPKDEQKEEQAEKVEEIAPAPAAAPGATALPNKFLDVIKQYVGKNTNLGTLKKFMGDYIVFEDDLTTILVPVNNIQSAKLVKDDEASPAQLEIKLISRD